MCCCCCCSVFLLLLKLLLATCHLVVLLPLLPPPFANTTPTTTTGSTILSSMVALRQGLRPVPSEVPLNLLISFVWSCFFCSCSLVGLRLVTKHSLSPSQQEQVLLSSSVLLQLPLVSIASSEAPQAASGLSLKPEHPRLSPLTHKTLIQGT